MFSSKSQLSMIALKTTDPVQFWGTIIGGNTDQYVAFQGIADVLFGMLTLRKLGLAELPERGVMFVKFADLLKP